MELNLYLLWREVKGYGEVSGLIIAASSESAARDIAYRNSDELGPMLLSRAVENFTGEGNFEGRDEDAEEWLTLAKCLKIGVAQPEIDAGIILADVRRG